MRLVALITVALALTLASLLVSVILQLAFIDR
jgi:hypothetical protein